MRDRNGNASKQLVASRGGGAVDRDALMIRGLTGGGSERPILEKKIGRRA
jgi:hypothetical protein